MPQSAFPTPHLAAFPKAVAVDALFKALAAPTRMRIVRLLARMELAVGELAQVLGQSQPRVSRHVGILCDAGLAERRREGSWVFLRGGGGLDGAPLRAAARAQRARTRRLAARRPTSRRDLDLSPSGAWRRSRAAVEPIGGPAPSDLAKTP